MRLLLAAIGVIILLTGAVWALQGAYILPATFMQGPAWIGIGAIVAAAGVGMIFYAQRKSARLERA